MIRNFSAATAIIALLSTSGAPLAAQTRPADPWARPDGPQIQPPRPGYPGGPQIQPVRPGYGQQSIRCESIRYKPKRCTVDTGNRVQVQRVLGGECRQGRTWGFDRRSIWVGKGCRAVFSYGYGQGGQYPNPGYPDHDRDKDKGPSTGAIIAGVAVAGGLIALLASNANKKKKDDAATTTQPATPATYPPGPPATLSADLSPLPSASRPSVQTCLHEAARQIGVTGGTRLTYDRLVSLEPGNGGWRFGAQLTAAYPDGDRSLPLYCRATPTKVIQLDFAAQ